MFFHPELANAGRPLFPGSDVDDQLKRIFKYPFSLEIRILLQKVSQFLRLLIVLLSSNLDFIYSLRLHSILFQNIFGGSVLLKAINACFNFIKLILFLKRLFSKPFILKYKKNLEWERFLFLSLMEYLRYYLLKHLFI